MMIRKKFSVFKEGEKLLRNDCLHCFRNTVRSLFLVRSDLSPFLGAGKRGLVSSRFGR